MSWKNKLYEYLFTVTYPFRSILGMQPRVMSVTATLDRILQGQSCVRFGDGEMKLIQMESIQFQHASEQLAEDLRTVLQTDHKDLMVCLPDIFCSLKYMKRKDRDYWYFYLMGNLKKDLLYIDKNKTFGNSFISRPYMIYKSKEIADEVFSRLPKVWDNKYVVIIEGKKTRFGCNNELLKNARKIRRILCPNFDAYYWRDQIVDAIRSVEKPDLVILALGPTATVLGEILYRDGYHVLDLGHLDIEYEWYLMGAEEKVGINGKLVTEIKNRSKIGQCDDKDYDESIIRMIGNLDE